MLKRIEARVGRGAMLVGAFLLATLLMCIPVGILGASNLVWGDANQYGTMSFPGTKVVHLPSGEVDVALALFIVGKGNETVDVPIPKDISLSLTPVNGTARPQISKDLGTSGNSLSGDTNSQRRVWTVQVPEDGDYTAKASGRLLGAGVNSRLWFGHGPPIPGVAVPFVAAGLVLLGGLVWFVILRLRGRRAGTTSPAAAALQGADAELDELDRIETEKAKVLDE